MLARPGKIQAPMPDQLKIWSERLHPDDRQTCLSRESRLKSDVMQQLLPRE